MTLKANKARAVCHKQMVLGNDALYAAACAENFTQSAFLFIGQLFVFLLQNIFMNKTLITLAAGIAIGILIAPRKGAETRKKIVDSFNDFTEDIADNADQLSTTGRNLATAVKNDARGFVQHLKDLGHEN